LDEETKGISFLMAKKNHRYVLASLILIMQLVLMPSAYADKRLELFLEKYDALNGRKPPLAHVDSPFYPYHRHLFEYGLDAEKLKSLRAAQKKGNCILVDELVIEGFLGLFPFLKPAFDDGKRHSILWFMIAKDHRPEIGRCRDHRGMREMLSLHPLGKLPPVDFAERNFGRSYDLLSPNEQSFYLHGFGERAFCDDYSPSIADLRAIANRPGGMVLTEQEGLYLLERARVHGLEKSKYEETLTRFKKQFSLHANLSRLRAASRQHTLKDIDFKVEGYWQSQCHFLQNFRQREMQ
jgi:hypothetical protein